MADPRCAGESTRCPTRSTSGCSGPRRVSCASACPAADAAVVRWPRDPWAAFDPSSPEGELCRATAERLERPSVEPARAPAVPPEVGRKHVGQEATQQAFGRFFVDLAHEAPEVAAHVVTVSPDVASSTNLGGWINRVGVWQLGERIDWFADDTDTLVRWRES